jgi:M6 family metalloprotease-like protein
VILPEAFHQSALRSKDLKTAQAELKSSMQSAACRNVRLHDPAPINDRRPRQCHDGIQSLRNRSSKRRKDYSVLPANVRSGMPIETAQYLEKDATLSGKLETFHIDDFTHPENEKFQYKITSSGQKIDFYPTQEIHVASGAIVKVQGYQMDNSLVVAADPNTTTFQITQTAPPPEAVGDQRTLVLLVDFPSSLARKYTRDEMQNFLFNGPLNNFYKEQSYNNVSFSGDVLDWVTLPQDLSPVDAHTCGIVSNEQIATIISNKNIDLSKYDRLLVIPSHQSLANGCSTVGKGDFIYKNYTYRLSISYVAYYGDLSPANLRALVTLVGHELGHALGVMHANAWDCASATLYGDCRHVEYGNIFDVMGGGVFAQHFNAFYKEFLGWIKPESTVLITTSGTYTINPFELASSSKKIAKIQMLNSTATPFYLEYRRGVGFDSTLNDPSVTQNQSGILINQIIPDLNSKLSSTRLLDMQPLQPASPSWYDKVKQSSLNSGMSFADAGRGITIDGVRSADASGITFDVKIGQGVCVHQEPGVIVTAPATAVGGKPFYIEVDMVNRDTELCPSSSSFIPVAVLPAGWQYGANEIHLAPNNSESYTASYITIIPPLSVSPGVYTLSVGAKNMSNNTQTLRRVDVSVRPGINLTNISPATAGVGTKVTLTGSGFSYASNLKMGFTRNKVLLTDPYTCGYITNPTIISDTSVEFTLPTKFETLVSGPSCYLDVISGTYRLILSDDMTQTDVKNFVISGPPLPAPVTLGLSNTPTLTMQYDSNGKESIITATFPVKIIAGSQDLQINKTDAGIDLGIYTTLGMTIPFPIITFRNPVNINDLLGYYVIKAGQTSTFDLVATYDAGYALPGTYLSTLRSIPFQNYPTSATSFPYNRTSGLTIIGNTAPYIGSINYYPGDRSFLPSMSITGTRFTTFNNTVRFKNIFTQTITDILAPSYIDSYDNHTVITLSAPNLSLGLHEVQVINSSGASSIKTVQVSAPQQTNLEIITGLTNIIKSRFFQTTGSALFDSNFDLDNDGKILASDYSLMKAMPDGVTAEQNQTINNKLLTALSNRMNAVMGSPQYIKELDITRDTKIDTVDYILLQGAMRRTVALKPSIKDAIANLISLPWSSIGNIGFSLLNK